MSDSWPNTLTEAVCNAVIKKLNGTKGFHVNSLPEDIEQEFIDDLRSSVAPIVAQANIALRARVAELERELEQYIDCDVPEDERYAPDVEVRDE